MYIFKTTCFVSLLLSTFVALTFSDNKQLTDIRERGSNESTSDKGAGNVIKNNLLTNNTQKVTPLLLRSNNSVSASSMQIVSEGGVVSSTTGSHNRRENVLENPTKTEINKTDGVKNTTLIKSEDIKPVHDPMIAPQQDDQKPSVPKKGVSFPDSDIQSKPYSPNITNEIKLNISNPLSNSFNKNISSITSNHTTSTNNTAKHKKPLVTDSDSDFINISKSNEETSKENVITLDQIDPLLVDRKSKRSDYIVPIVAVILSVPLVAILTSILYKRGTDWWQHRNYKRMDFLIEGMYHN